MTDHNWYFYFVLSGQMWSKSGKFDSWELIHGISAPHLLGKGHGFCWLLSWNEKNLSFKNTELYGDNYRTERVLTCGQWAWYKSVNIIHIKGLECQRVTYCFRKLCHFDYSKLAVRKCVLRNSTSELWRRVIRKKGIISLTEQIASLLWEETLFPVFLLVWVCCIIQ